MGVVTHSTPLAQAHEFRLGGVHVRPAARTIEGAGGSFATEPLVMQVLVQLSRNAGRVVSRREIFERCWGAAPVGDDSLNRVVAALRKTLTQADGGTVQIETIPGAGYTLRLVNRRSEGSATDVRDAVQDALDSIRLGLPEPDYLRLEMLRHAVQLNPDDPIAWGMRSLLCRYAAEYAPPDQIAEFVAECHRSAREALRLNSARHMRRLRWRRLLQSSGAGLSCARGCATCSKPIPKSSRRSTN
jgi:DNA-binding winged helix-turn-helix (wHTH) protein